jgi:hypothetical protein
VNAGNYFALCSINYFAGWSFFHVGSISLTAVAIGVGSRVASFSRLSYNVSQPRNGTLNALALHGIKERAVE